MVKKNMELCYVPVCEGFAYRLRWNRVEVTSGAATVSTEYPFCCDKSQSLKKFGKAETECVDV